MHSRGIAATAAVLLSIGLIAGCKSSTTTAPPTQPSSPAASTPAPSPSPSATTISLDTLKSEVDAAALTSAVVGATKPASNQTGTYAPMLVCGGRLASNATVVYAHAWTWVGSHINYVEHGVFAYQAESGSAVVAEAKTLATSCTGYNQTDPSATGHVVVNGADPIAAPAGVDGFYAFCEPSTTTSPAKYKGQKATICTAVMSRSQIVVTVRVFGKTATLAAARSALKAALAPAARALIAAVPAAAS